MFLSTERKSFEFEITVLGQSAEFSLNCNISFFYKRDRGATPVFIYIFIYIIILLVFLILLFSTYLLINLINQTFTYIAKHYLVEFLQLSLTLLFIWLKNTLVGYVEMRFEIKTAHPMWSMWSVVPYWLHKNKHKKIWKAKIRFHILVLSNLFIWVSFFPNEQ